MPLPIPSQLTLARPRPDTTGLLVIDIQEKFRPAIGAFDSVVENAATLVRAFTILAMPVFVTEQYPIGLGPTVTPLAKVVPPATIPFVKKCFSCCSAEGFMQGLKNKGVSVIALCGIETHVCVYQTALDLMERGIEVMVVADAVGSRKESDHAIALRRMEQAGAIILSLEMLLFDLLRTADSPHFKEIQKLVK